MQMKSEYPVDGLVELLNHPASRSSVEFVRSQMRLAGERSSLRVVDVEAVQGELRSYIEEWIETGIQNDNSEKRDQRRFVPAQSVGTVEPAVFPKALRALANVWGGDLLVRAPRTGPWTYQIVSNAQKQAFVAMNIAIGPTGGLEYHPIIRKRTDPTESGSAMIDPESASQLNIGDRDAQDQFDPIPIAAKIFEAYYRSEWLFGLMQCRRCRTFEAPKPPESRTPRKVFERGWHCRRCSHAAPTEARRLKKKSELINLTAKAYEKWNQMHPNRRRDRVLWILAEVNKGLPYGEHVARRTISQILKEIGPDANGSS
jgi:hypothetical protein